MALQSVRFGVRWQKLSNVGQSLDGDQKFIISKLVHAWEGTLSPWFRLYL
jgi:hypothetical protein